MRRTLAVSALALLPVALAGCGAGTASVPTVVKAPPQAAKLGWVEPYPAKQPALIFRVASFTVTREGWSADVSVENTSDIGWEVGAPRTQAERAWGVMLFPNGDAGELERRNREQDLPAIRPATRFVPALPVVLESGKTWAGTISAPGALAGGLWARLSFGPFASVGNVPDGVVSPVVWFTDHAYHLDVGAVSAQPA